MNTITTAEGMQRLRDSMPPGQRIGFVPTMGALHDGHLALVRQAVAENDRAVASIFVNPTQFDRAEDLDSYPRHEDRDAALLESVGCDVLFLPSVEEVYPPGLDTTVSVDLGGLETRMEGAFRPGHFDGVQQVVHRLLQLVQPQVLYMGQKDYQQFLIIKKMVTELGLDITVRCHPIVREASGLAMSSRNERLTPAQRRAAAHIYRALSTLEDTAGEKPLAAAQRTAWKTLHQPGFRPEYLTLVDGEQLTPVEQWEDAATIVALAAVWVGEVRLIDNVILKQDNHYSHSQPAPAE